MRLKQHLPLGIDVGTSRIRISVFEKEDSAITLRRVIVRPRTIEGANRESVAGDIRTALCDEAVSEKRVIAAVGEPHASVRSVTLPTMTARERESAARYEAARFVAYPLREAHVRILSHPNDPHAYVLGIARKPVIRQLLLSLRQAGLRVIAVDHEAYALQRVFPFADAILDVGYAGARLYAYGEAAPISAALDVGGHTFTTAIRRDLTLTETTAEQRKRSLGLAGAGEVELADFSKSVTGALLNARNLGAREVQRLVLTGNGARLSALVERLERDTGSSVTLAAGLAVLRSGYPDDVARAAAPDWALSIGIAMWNLTRRGRS